MKAYLYFYLGFFLVFGLACHVYAQDLTGIPVAAAGSTLKSDIASLGKIQTATGAVPFFELSKTADISVSTVDLPAVLSVGPVDLVTAASFPAAASTLIGKMVFQSGTLAGLAAAAAAVAPGVADALKAAVAASVVPAASGVPIVGDVVHTTDLGSYNYQIGEWTSCDLYDPTNWNNTTASYVISPTLHWGGKYTSVYKYDSSTYMRCTALVTQTVAPATFPGDGSAGGSINYSALGVAIAPIIATSTGKAELERLWASASGPPVKTTDVAPTTEAPTQPLAKGITQADLDVFMQKNLAAVAQKGAEIAAAAAAASPGDAAAAALAAQTAVTAAGATNAATGIQSIPGTDPAGDDPPAETFAVPGAPTGFGTAYTPGDAVDIPGRFSNFLGSLRGSSLFGLTSGVFGSVPSGGAPVYTIEAGQYGSHSVDLSETMAVGLDVLKAVVMCVFGFLSVRCIIMKR